MVFRVCKKMPPLCWSVVLLLVLIGSSSRLGLAQNTNQTNPTTDPFEAGIVNSMFQRLGVRPPTQWNFSGELCSGLAIGATDLQNLNPGIKCDCFNDGSLCHITALRLYQMDLGGNIPFEIWNLTYLDDLDLRGNSFTGPIPALISRLSRMQFLSFGFNALSGQLPKELGMLSDLRSLAFDVNNFTGSLPSEIGNLSRLTQFYFASSGVSGTIPPNYANLKSLTTVWGSNNPLTGQIPDFIGNWSQLSVLRLQGNSFQGPIPSSFSNLTSLTDLRINNLSNATFSLEFIRDMKSLSILNLRTNNISGSIPPSIGELQNLQQLDLSFNSLSGAIPDSLFSVTSLTHLFLGNNTLTGSLPQQKSSDLQNIDVSNNKLSGSLPSWANNRNLQLNLITNNFTSSDLDSSLPSGSYCLQSSFPCYRGSPRYYNFYINCGGPALRSSNGSQYEADNQISGPATYYVTRSRRWGVSNAGIPADGPDPKYTFSSSNRFTNTSDPEIFQSSRISAGSLRYFGLAMENGNYTVNLLFAESEILDVGWRSLGRRVFDIYVQGNLVEQDFDIKKAAGGRSFTAVQRTFKVNVTENYLEIHLFWAGKGTCCVPGQGSYGPMVSAISATPDFTPTVSNIPPASGKKNQIGLIVGIVAGVGAISLLFVCCLCLFIRRRKKQQIPEEEDFLEMDLRPYTFSYAELRAATEGFSPANKLGEGGFGPVFKGTLYDGRVVAVKQLSEESNQGKREFVAEIAVISAVQHRNLVKFYGCCVEGDRRSLVYEYLENRSLDQALFGKRLHLDWPKRFEICLGVARGLAYLHENSRVRIVHRDVKASNVLLDSDLNPKISDFGLAKLFDEKLTHMNTRVAGTAGYLAPEYAMRGHLTEKADVFGFGVVALEIVSGRPNSNSSSNSNTDEDDIYLLELAWNMHEMGQDIELVDPTLVTFSEKEVRRVIDVALLCTQTSPVSRPSMSRALAMLSGDIEVTRITKRPDYLNDWNAANYLTGNDTATTVTTTGDDSHYYDSSINTPADANCLPINSVVDPILGQTRSDTRW